MTASPTATRTAARARPCADDARAHARRRPQDRAARGRRRRRRRRPARCRSRIKAIGLNHIDVWGWRGMAFAKRKLPLVVGVEAAGEIAAVGPDVTALQGRRPRRRLWRADLRHLQGLPRGPRQSLRERRRHHGLSCRRLRPRSASTCRRGWSIPVPAGVSFRDAACAPVAFAHRAAHAVRQCQARARRDHSGAGRRLRHRHRRDQDGEGDRLHRHHHRRRRRQGGEGQGARRRPRHQLPHRPLRRRGAQAHRQEGRRCRLRACRPRHLQRLAALPQARRPAGHLRLDLGPVDHHQPVPALSCSNTASSARSAPRCATSARASPRWRRVCCR